jgi:chemotaxis protein CheD
MLPEARDKNTTEIGKYADTAVPYVIKQMIERGASKHRLKVAMTGGAQLFAFEGMTDRLDVGKRNIEAVLNHLGKEKIKMLASDVGGKSGRTVTLDAKTGEMIVKQVGGKDIELINFLKH